MFVVPGNAGTAEVGENVDLKVTDFEGIAAFVAREGVEMVVVGPEDPLVAGVRDFLEGDDRTRGVLVVGPGRDGARLEGSKDFAKAFMGRHGIPTARHVTVTAETVEEGLAFLREVQPPYVLKADGLAAGKGVLIVEGLEEAERELKEMLGGKFGGAGRRVVIEEFLQGIELSVFALTDGKTYRVLGSAKDYKRVGEGDKGLNTGGMGAVSPVPFADEAFCRRVEERIVRPTVEGLREEGIDYRGFLFFGLMNVGGDPYVIEYNARMGDPETEVVLPRLQGDLVTLLEAVARGQLEGVEFGQDERYCTTVMLVSGGYPGAYEKGKVIEGVENVKDCVVFHAGTKREDGRLVTNGGRVLALSAFGGTMDEALARCYAGVKEVRFEGMNFRRDIGFDLR